MTSNDKPEPSVSSCDNMRPPSSKLPIGERLLPALLDEYALYEPDKLIAIVPADAAMHSWHRVNYRQLKRVVDHLAWDLEKKIGRSDFFDPIVYMGGSDIRYMCFWLAAMKCGYSNLVLSPRNSPEEQRHLLETASCKVIFHSRELSEKVAGIQKILAWQLTTFLVPSYPDLVVASATPDAKPYPFTHTFAEWADKPAITFHTSGTTGMPKPITNCHFYFATMDRLSILPVPAGRKQANWCVLNSGDMYFNGFPPFHPAGSSFACITPLHLGAVFVLHAPETPLNVDAFLKAAGQFDLDAAFLPPSFIEDLADSPDGLEALSKIDYVFSMAGPLGLESGDKVSQRTKLVQLIGSTEAGLMAGLIPKNWRGFEWNPYYGDEMQLIEGTDSFERILTKNPKYAKYHAIWSTFPDITEWRTRDLFVRDVEDPNFWTFVGRTDDVIVLSNGEKVQPVTMQIRIQDHPLLKSAVVFGQGKFQVGLLIEPDYVKWDPSQPDHNLIDEVWPTVEEACRHSTSTGRIFKNMIIVAAFDKPIPRAGKGTVLTAKALNLYRDEIDQIYARNERVDFTLPIPGGLDEAAMRKFVRDIVTPIMGADDILDDDHLFARGMDSLQAMNIARTLLSTVKSAVKGENSGIRNFTPRTIYQNPTITMLARVLLKITQRSALPEAGGFDVQHESSPETVIQTMIERHIQGLPDTKPTPTKGREDGLHVLVIGTTGSLGPYLLHSVASDPKVAQVYCLNRSLDAERRTLDSLSRRGLPSVLPDAEFLTAKFGEQWFGLDEATYENICQKVDLVFHNAWAVNFNYSLEAFEYPFVKFVSDLSEFSIQGAHRPHVFFISSIGTVGGWRPSPDKDPLAPLTVPETIMYHSAASIRTGYAESKHVAERVLAAGAQKAGVPVTLARLGQIAGPTTSQGRWNDAEWLPRIIKTSATIGKLPLTLGSLAGEGVDWIPVDRMAAACVEIGFRRLQGQDKLVIDVVHLENPRLSHWGDLVPTVQQHFAASGSALQGVSYAEWLDEVQHYADNELATGQDLPVLPMIDYYQSASATVKRIRPATEKAQAYSRVIATLEPITPRLMETWLKQWEY